jgi:signal transduction histidine kinase
MPLVFLAREPDSQQQPQKRLISGTGLGLLIVRRCVNLHGGEIGFDSTDCQGTTFTVRLPLFTA